MPIISAYIVPHPPLIIPEIGKGEQLKIQKTIDAMELISRRIAETEPDTVIFITPHSVSYSDYIHISPGLTAEGNFGRFGAEDVSFGIMYEKKLVSDVTNFCERNGISAGNMGGDDEPNGLDHGVMVPLYFMNKHFQDYRCLRVSVSSLPCSEHYKLGMVLADVCDMFYRNTVVIASGDLSHRLKHDGPYGFSPAGPEFDARIQDIVKSGDFSGFMNFTDDERRSAAECGLLPFVVMAGTLDKKSVRSELLSYECPFGVGYAVGEFVVNGDDETRCFIEQ